MTVIKREGKNRKVSDYLGGNTRRACVFRVSAEDYDYVPSENGKRSIKVGIITRSKIVRK